MSKRKYRVDVSYRVKGYQNKKQATQVLKDSGHFGEWMQSKERAEMIAQKLEKDTEFFFDVAETEIGALKKFGL